MDSKNQLQIFLACVCIGLLGGVFYEIVALLRLLFGCERGKNRWLGNGLDFLFFILFGVFCVFAAFWLHFPAIRGYMWVGFALEGGLYAKTLRRIVAFLEKMWYTKGKKVVKRRKKSVTAGVESL